MIFFIIIIYILSNDFKIYGYKWFNNFGNGVVLWMCLILEIYVIVCFKFKLNL